MDADSSLAYRRALGAFATGVAVILVEDARGPVGLTVNSFTSVSLDPPLILWCLGTDTERYASFAEAERFSVNVLSAQQQDRSERFSRTDGRAESVEVDRAPSGTPMLPGALTRLDCVVHDRSTVGDHLIVVGRVERFETREGDGLTYYRGRYGAASLENA